MNPALAIGQDIIGAFLMIAILMQARGSGLSATFGGDSSVYRSRRGIRTITLRPEPAPWPIEQTDEENMDRDDHN